MMNNEGEIERYTAIWEGVDLDVLEELVWDGLRKSIKDGRRTQFDSDLLFYDWFRKQHQVTEVDQPVQPMNG